MQLLWLIKWRVINADLTLMCSLKREKKKEEAHLSPPGISLPLRSLTGRESQPAFGQRDVRGESWTVTRGLCFDE